jgi:hypothetical protein
MRTLRRFLSLILFFPLANALAQTAPMAGVPASAEVARLAPQLLTFAGSQANLDSLVSALTTGSTTTLTTTLTDGSTQIVTLTPASGGLSTTQIAQLLEQARQQLIGRGIVAPTAQQIGVTLVGGQLPTPNGAVQVNGLVPVASAAAGASAFSSPLTVETRPAAGATAPTAAGATSAAAGGNISNSPLPRGISDTPPPPNNPAVAPPAINAPQQPMTTPPSAPSAPRPFR